ncbi:Chaperone protein DnaJ [Planctomycetes bacterium Pan216]|uniref:Chaperone protein DnaJ n=1 Tax=Kolteria novifilia TaxID=2527975 RepID=A0A518B4P4_9BACT|nr:Chaperone protein DnaJ [Planctomycetes bacterium Pan216]
MNNSASDDPFMTLGLPRIASEEQIRSRYLELVKQFPPEREPQKFREIRAAYEAVRDPLLIAERLLEPPDDDEAPQWEDAIEEQKEVPPKMTPAFLLSLGNRDERYRAPSEAKAQHITARDSDAAVDQSP